MGFLSSDKTSSSSTQNYDETNLNTLDNRVSGDDSITGGNQTVSQVNGNVKLTTTDFGSVAGGLNVANNALAANVEVFGDSVDLASLAVSANENAFLGALDNIKETNAVANQLSMQAIDKSFTLAGESTRSEETTTTNNLIKYGAVVAVLVVVAFVVVKGK